jgi:hypothetical protein
VSNFLPNGIGETVGDDLASTSPIYTAGDIWYVHSPTGIDGTWPAGRNKEKPLASLESAIDNAESGDIIVLLAGHTETRTTPQLFFSKSVTIVGVGTTAGKPSPQLLNNAPVSSMWIVTDPAIYVEVRNVYFPAQVQSCSAVKIANTQGNLRFVGCYFEANAFDTAAVISIPATGTASTFGFIGSTMISTGTSMTSQPRVGISGTLHTAHVRLDGSIFSDGLYGWSGDSAVTITAADVTESIRGVGVSLLLGATLALPPIRTWVQVTTATGGGRVVI